MRAPDYGLIVIGTFILLCMVYMVGHVNGQQSGRKSLQIQCVKEGRAEWLPNPDGTTTFVWKTP